MAYEKHTWETGEVITAEKLNNIEDGVSENEPVVIITETPGMTTTYSCNMTYEELRSLIPEDTISSIVHFRYKVSSAPSGVWDFVAGIYSWDSNSNVMLRTIDIAAMNLCTITITPQNSVSVTKQKF